LPVASWLKPSPIVGIAVVDVAGFILGRRPCSHSDPRLCGDY